MSLYIDLKFVSLLSPKLDKFHQKSQYLWNFRCPICGDSQKNKLKMRGYVYRRKSDLFFTCHNCNTNLSFGNLLKTLDRSLYREYQMERYKNESAGNVKQPDFSLAKTKPVFEKKTKIDLPTIQSLPEDHAAKKYLIDRKLPRDKFASIYYANDFKAFVHELLPDYDKTLIDGEKRIVFPFYDEKNTLLGLQGRALMNTKVKYITIKLGEENTKVFGLNTVDLSKRVYVVEGPIDSLFLQNSIAMMDASLYNAVLSVGNHDFVFVYDNEPRNKEIVKHMQRTIEMGKNICIWPKTVAQKDINEMILAGRTSAEIQHIIDSNTFCDLRAKLEFETWRKS